MYTVVSGKDFKEMFPEIHFGLPYNDGFHKEDSITIDPTDMCQSGDIYFTNEQNISHWIASMSPTPQWIQKVKICDDAKVHIEEKRFKIDKIVFLERESLWDNIKYCILAVQKKGVLLEYVKDQTPELCEMAVRQNGNALKYVKDQTHELCELAVRQNGLALQYVIDQTSELCELAVQQNGCALSIIKKPTRELCELAAKQLKKLHMKQMVSLLANK